MCLAKGVERGPGGDQVRHDAHGTPDGPDAIPASHADAAHAAGYPHSSTLRIGVGTIQSRQ